MFLTSLTMRGFKSFADKTTIEVEPGVTVIVGPNGSGKSNIVDALSWVLGTHSPRKVRGGSMQDVIFAGSPTRPALGMARVEITIDNSDGTLGRDGIGTAGSAQQFSEIRIAREITSSGDSSYLINGQQVRALDVQELLSDAGLGRELHTIVGQGQLDAILNAKPEDRRALIEEAAGILKHRRRRERAVKKLEQVDGHVDKLVSILRELRRQLRPLERQAEAANEASRLQSDLRDVRVSMLATDLDRLTADALHGARLDDEVAAQQTATEHDIEAQRAQLARLDEQLAELSPSARRSTETFHALQSLLERLRGTADLIDARRRHLLEYNEEPLAGRPPEELRAQADRTEAEASQRDADRVAAREVLEEATAARRATEIDRRAFEQRRQAEAQRRAQQREARLRWEGEVSAMRGRIASAESELGRVTSQRDSIAERLTEATTDMDAVQVEIQNLDSNETALTTELEAAEADVERATLRLDELVELERGHERERASQSARAEALRASLQDRRDAARALLSADPVAGLHGVVADHVHVAEEHRSLVASALAGLGGAVVAVDDAAALDALTWLGSAGEGRGTVLSLAVSKVSLASDSADRLKAAGARAVGDLVSARPDDAVADPAVTARVATTLRRALGACFIVPDAAAAIALHRSDPSLVLVTPAGDVIGARGWVGGEAPRDDAVLTASSALDAEERAGAARLAIEDVAVEIVTAREALSTARARLGAATSRINESDARITSAAERLARVNKEVKSLHRQTETVAGQERELNEAHQRNEEALERLLGRGPEEPEAEDPDDTRMLDEAQDLDEAVEAAREVELDRRVAVERIEEHLRHLLATVAELRVEADEVERSLADAARRRESRREGIVRCGELASFCADALTGLTDSIEQARAERTRLEQAVRERRDAREATRTQLDQLGSALEDVREQRHRAELKHAEIRRDLDQVVATLRSDHSLSAEEVAAEHPEASTYDRKDLATQEEVLVRRIGLLGRVNPLALEEFQALEERHTFLSDQLADLRASRRDLEQVIVTVDDRIKTVFMDAFNDVSREFDLTFQTVFPGGEGRLVLTDPDDPLTTGIEVEARPPGKKVTRLSLLSGGERSLTVLAFVFAIFRARPSPFYVLDEVDAALDDVNLQRLLRVLTSFKDRAQLIVVTHQKRSMEIADVLYGVTMGNDAVTRVLAEKFTDEQQQRLDDGVVVGV